MNVLLCSIKTLEWLYDVSSVEVGQHSYWPLANTPGCGVGLISLNNGFLFFPNLIKYKEKEIRVVLCLLFKMVSQHQTKDSGSKKNGDKELGMVAPQDISLRRRRIVHCVFGTLQRVPLVDKKWSQIPKEIKEQIWEAVDTGLLSLGRNSSTIIDCLEKDMHDWRMELEETMPEVEKLNRSTLWKRARQDKQGNIPDPKCGRRKQN
ncbi:hypothetical protein L3X38_042578 [Prunus dulcis]|uniref:Uncharacterized protein n=1 Tax=Prunus dulcis TaxID=3755 RepID=A0AAD4YLP0_PRUDU|nr:hypothetical protein L3X38_042578 [Prunus dulcis]